LISVTIEESYEIFGCKSIIARNGTRKILLNVSIYGLAFYLLTVTNIPSVSKYLSPFTKTVPTGMSKISIQFKNKTVVSCNHKKPDRSFIFIRRPNCGICDNVPIL
jgi:hypothetical protein